MVKSQNAFKNALCGSITKYQLISNDFFFFLRNSVKNAKNPSKMLKNSISDSFSTFRHCCSEKSEKAAVS